MMTVLFATLIAGFIFILIYHLRWRRTSRKVIYVIVLGDIGRSPRMQYHAISLAHSGFRVILIGFPGSRPHNEVLKSELIYVSYLPISPKILKGLPPPFNFLLPVIINATSLLVFLIYHARPTHILVQNPPSIPTMFISWLMCRLRGSRLIFDWHNYGYSIMSLGLGGPNHSLVRIYKWYEKKFGTFSDDNICVTRGMKEDLDSNWNIRATTLYDRPPSFFRRLEDGERKQFLQEKLPILRDIEESTGFHNPALVLSSTSWTPDEDFGILLEALDVYDEQASSSSDLPFVLCIVTGKGPLKEYYRALINEKNWAKVKVITPWLEAEDYPRLLGSGDIGICLHTSSSGLDLPMKVVDMFGCLLPVCAVQYKCIEELIKENVTGLTFKSAKQLGDELAALLKKFPEGCKRLKKLRFNLESMTREGWDENWMKNVSHLFN